MYVWDETFTIHQAELEKNTRAEGIRGAPLTFLIRRKSFETRQSAGVYIHIRFHIQII